VDRMGIIWAKKDWKGDTPPKSVLEPIEYEFDANLVRDIYAIFKRTYDGFELGKPKVRKPLPKTFSLEMNKSRYKYLTCQESKENMKLIIDRNRFKNGKANYSAIGWAIGIDYETAQNWIKKIGLSDYADIQLEMIDG